MCAVLTPEQFQYGAAGVPMPSMEVKLVDVKEAGYLTSATPQRGEIWLRGASVTRGYFKRDDLNNDESIFTKDGWFRTGDVGEWNPDGTIKVIDRSARLLGRTIRSSRFWSSRIKNLVKLQGGEYIALERLESVYKSCNLVANICVHVTPDAKQPMALVFPHEANLRHYLATTPPPGFTGDAKGTDLHALSADKAVAGAVLKECIAVARKEGFKSIEILELVVLTPDEWTPESGLVTAAQKIQRRAITTRYKAEIEVCGPSLVSFCYPTLTDDISTGCIQTIKCLAIPSRCPLLMPAFLHDFRYRSVSCYKHLPYIFFALLCLVQR